jgi:hypothetical protein
MCVLFSLGAFLESSKIVNPPWTREEYRFLARESLHEDVISTIAYAEETTINASAVLCGVST